MIPFHTLPPLSSTPITHESYSPLSIKGKALEGEVGALLLKGAIEPAPPGPGYYSRVFVVSKANGGWRPIIDLSVLNHYVVKTKFKMESNQSVLRSIRRNDWMVTIDLKDAYLQIPVHPSSRRYLRFVSPDGRTWQFRVLCFGLTTAPQVFTRVMAPVSHFLHRLGVRILRYLDDWLILASSREEAIRARDLCLLLCQELGIIINPQKSSLEPSQTMTYLGVRLDSQTFLASPTPERMERFFLTTEEFLSSEEQLAKLWRVLLGLLASLILLVPGGRLRMRAVQLALREGWDFQDEDTLVPLNSSCREDLRWWLEEGHLDQGLSLESQVPDVFLWSDASDQGWGAVLGDNFAKGLWTTQERNSSINFRELLAVERGLLAFPLLVQGKVVGLFCDNTTAIAYLRKQGGTLSPLLNEIAQRILRWAEKENVSLLPQFILGRKNVVADALSRPNQVLSSEWILHQDVFDSLNKKWPVMIDLFATGLSRRCSIYFAPTWDPMAAGVDAMLQSWDYLQAYAFPPFSMIRVTLNKVRESKGLLVTLIAPFWPSREWFPDLLGLLVDVPLELPLIPKLLRQPQSFLFHQRLQWLRLHAWRLSSNSPGQSESLLQWLRELVSAEENHL